MSAAPRSPILDFSFAHHWRAEVLPARPAILPARHFTYPREAEEIERGALEVLVRPGRPIPGASDPDTGRREETAAGAPGPDVGRSEETAAGAPGPDSGTGEPSTKNLLGAPDPDSGIRESATADSPRPNAQPFLATCALGFRDPVAPTGLWSAPHPAWLCAVSGGYAYLIDTTAPERFIMLPYRPVLEVRAAADDGLLLFVSHHKILAWGRDGQAWESEKLSDEGVTITAIEPGVVRGLGWEMRTDRETPFDLDLRTGRRKSSAAPAQAT